MTLFALERFIRPLDFSETLPKHGENCYERTSSTAHPVKTLVRVPGGLSGLKTPHFGGFSNFCPKCHYVCLSNGFLRC